VVQVSPYWASQAPFPQQLPQSLAHDWQVSPYWASQAPLPQQLPQSLAHDWHVSFPVHLPSPQTGGHWPQTAHALPQQSPAATQAASHQQLPPLLPHWHEEQEFGSSGQSPGQLHESSPAWQSPLPHTTGTPPHPRLVTSSTHRESHATSQQYMSLGQTQASIFSSSQPGLEWTWRQLP